MGKFDKITQFVLACIVFLCVVVEIIAQAAMGRIHSVVGLIVAGILALLSWGIVSVSWKELREGAK